MKLSKRERIVGYETPGGRFICTDCANTDELDDLEPILVSDMVDTSYQCKMCDELITG